MKIDWQAFDAGILSVEEEKTAREVLQRDPAARAEYDGFLRFKAQVRAAGMAEPVPLQSLQDKTTVVARQTFPIWPVGLAACVVVVGVLLATIVFSSKKDPLAVHSLKTSNPVIARQFLERESGFELGDLDPSPAATLQVVSANSFEVKYGMTAKSTPVTLSVHKLGKRLFRAGMLNRNGQKYFATKQADGLTAIVWRGSALEFSLIGLSLPDAWALVDHLSRQTLNWNAGRPASRNGAMVGEERQDSQQ